tara:strand:- start:237 stop:605 length:369 start_codon:yes stop_codon:yes gene_type:complete
MNMIVNKGFMNMTNYVAKLDENDGVYILMFRQRENNKNIYVAIDSSSGYPYNVYSILRASRWGTKKAALSYAKLFEKNMDVLLTEIKEIHLDVDYNTTEDIRRTMALEKLTDDEKKLLGLTK